MSISALVAAVGTDVLIPWAVPDAGGAEFDDVVFYEATEPFVAGPTDLVLGVGLTPGQVEQLLDLAADRGAAGVVCRQSTGARERLQARARRAGVALLVVGAAVGWAQLSSHIRNLVSTSGSQPESDLGAATRHDLVWVANTLALAVGGSVLIFNPQQELLAASRLEPDSDEVRHRAVFAQHGPDEYRARLRELGVYDELWQGDQVVEVEPIPELGAGRRQVIAVRAGAEILGSIWVAEGVRSLAPDSRAILKNAAPIVSRHLVSRHAQAQPDRQFAEELTRQLVAGEADVVAAATWLEVDPSRPCRVIAVAVPDEVHGESRRLADLLLLYFSAYRHRVLPVVARGRIYLVTCDTASASVDTPVVRDLVTRAAGALRLDVRAVVGPVVPALERAGTSREDADRGLRVLAGRAVPGTSVHDVDDLLPSVQMLHLAELLPGLTGVDRAAVTRLRAYDSEHQTALADTLAGWLDAFGDVSVASKALHVHPNTVRYRLRKAVAVSGIDLDDPDARLMAAVVLRADELSRTPTK
ncbi:MAG TPA: helix-turn-helix domain-containing protein [Marmoricola sp.]|nr:helix-turn-helix domain-containing protein [Marmoricola sp.]